MHDKGYLSFTTLEELTIKTSVINDFSGDNKKRGYKGLIYKLITIRPFWRLWTRFEPISYMIY